MPKKRYFRKKRISGSTVAKKPVDKKQNKRIAKLERLVQPEFKRQVWTSHGYDDGSYGQAVYYSEIVNPFASGATCTDLKGIGPIIDSNNPTDNYCETSPMGFPGIVNYSVVSAVVRTAQGVSVNQRIGNEIRLRYIRMRMHIESTLAQTNSVVRVMLIHDRSARTDLNTDPPVFLIDYNDPYSSPDNNFVRNVLKDDKEKTKPISILYDSGHFYLAAVNGNNAGNNYARTLRINKSMNTNFSFSDATGNSNDVGQIYLAIISTGTPLGWRYELTYYYTDS